MTTLDTICQQYSSPCRMWAGTTLFLVAHDAEDIETVLKSPNSLKRMYIYEFIRDAISDTVDGLFTSSGNDPFIDGNQVFANAAFNIRCNMEASP